MTGILRQPGLKSLMARVAVATLVFAVMAAVALSPARGAPRAAAHRHHHRSKVFVPMSDAAAARHVIRTREGRPANGAANHYMPSASELAAFRSARNNLGYTAGQWDPYYRYVTGHFTGTTDEIIQWASWKWGIPVDLLRAQYMQESLEFQTGLGDVEAVPASWYYLYPPQARVPGRLEVYETMGISQIKWKPDGSVGAGTEPLRWKSTAFAADYQAATLRFYFDDPGGRRRAWGDSSYRPRQGWNSIAAWYDPFPWGNSAQEWYIGFIKHQLNTRSWYTAKDSRWRAHMWVPERHVVKSWRPA